MRRILLCILDGWGHRPYDDNNGIRHAPYWQTLLSNNPHTFLHASEYYVGLPDGQMGNSEVGHMTIGLGRVIQQELPRINNAIESGNFENNPTFQSFMQRIKQSNNRCHVMGLLSPGGVHSHEQHFFHTLRLLTQHGISVIAHPILDGRDTPPQSARTSLEALNTLCHNTTQGKISIGTLSGRYFTMDRDQRWERIQKTYNAFINNDAPSYNTTIEALEHAYACGITDEFVDPCIIDHTQKFQENDAFFFINFRADRARQWMQALLTPDETGLQHPKNLHFSDVLTMCPYAEELSPHHHVLFPKESLRSSLGEVVAQHALCQLRIAETEKYAHVTYFFNGGIEHAFNEEDRILIPSPKVATYDMHPEMSADAITTSIEHALSKHKYHLIVANYANPDMVGHTGAISAIEKAVETIDSMLKRLVTACIQHDWTLILTADHGNVECMRDDNGMPHTAHTCNVVPYVVINHDTTLSLAPTGTLADIAPTILHWMNLPIPNDMSGHSLQISPCY